MTDRIYVNSVLSTTFIESLDKVTVEPSTAIPGAFVLRFSSTLCIDGIPFSVLDSIASQSAFAIHGWLTTHTCSLCDKPSDTPDLGAWIESQLAHQLCIDKSQHPSTLAHKSTAYAEWEV